MSRENVEVVRRANDALNRHAWSELRECFADDLVYHDQAASPTVDLPSVVRGRDALLSGLLDVSAALGDLQREMEQLIDAGDRVVSVGHWRGSGNESGAPAHQSEAIVWTVRDGRIVEGRAFGSREQALEAVGLSSSEAIQG